MAGVTAMEAGNRIIEENIIQTDKKNIGCKRDAVAVAKCYLTVIHFIALRENLVPSIKKTKRSCGHNTKRI